MSVQCKIIEDILPLYHDNVCSAESRAMVEEHLSQCEHCKKLLEQIAIEPVSTDSCDDTAAFKRIRSAIVGQRRKALLVGISVTLAAVLLVFAGASAVWYCREYSYYLSFAEAQPSDMAVGSIEPYTASNGRHYVWNDDCYLYDVVVPDFLSTGGYIGMSRLDNSNECYISLAISRWDNQKYVFHIFVNEENTVNYFIVDSNLTLRGNYCEDELQYKQSKLEQYKTELQTLVDAAEAMWPFIE